MSALLSTMRPRIADTSALPLSSQSIITEKHEGAKVDVRATNKRPRVTPSSDAIRKEPVTVNKNANKRPRVNPSSDAIRKEPVTVNKNSISPVEFLRALLRKHAISQSSQSYDGSFFTKPNEEEIAAYNLDMVGAIRNRDIDTLRAFHKEGRSLNACNRFGESLLHMSCRRGDTELVKFLVEEIGVRINVKDDYGRTPLHDACWTATPNFEIMKVLMKASATSMLLAADVRGHTPFDYARKEHWGAWLEFWYDNRELLVQPDKA